MRKVVAIIACVLIVTAGVRPQTAPKVHQLNASPQTVHRNFFDASLKPVLTVNSGDIVKLETATGNPRYFERLGVPKEKIPAELYDPGVVVPLKPFWGVIGVAPPPSMGRVPSGPPGIFGGNMDNRDLVGGTTLYLPVFVPGALVSVGDGHAAQGYGEVCLSAIETSLKGEIQVVLHKNKPLKQPRAETPTHFMTMGLNADLDEATKIATREMLDWVVEMKGLSRDDAYMLASAAMDLVVTQVVDGTKGIHAIMPKAIFKK